MTIYAKSWSWQTKDVCEHENQTRALPGISKLGSRMINTAIVLSAFPVMNLVAAGLFLCVAWELQKGDVYQKAEVKSFVAMAAVTAVAGFVPLAMPIIFAIGTKLQTPEFTGTEPARARANPDA